MKILLTGCLGFIGYHLSIRLLKERFNVIGIDNINNYYDQNLKLDRLKNIANFSRDNAHNWQFEKMDIIERNNIDSLFIDNNIEIVIHLAAQAGVRYSISNPRSYIESNLVGFSNILENCRNKKIKHFLYASSSSVYGGNTRIPFSENDSINHPVSLYAATKRANELMAHSYSHLYSIPSTGMRFFTVYGPWGRPDMAPMIFAKSIFEKKPIAIFNKGIMYRDFTYIDDVIESIFRLIKKPPTPFINKEDKYSAANSWSPYRIFNIGCNSKILLLDFIKILEDEIGIKAVKDYKEMQPGDVKTTFADTKMLREWINYSPQTNLKNGISRFINWFKKYFDY